MQARMGSFVTAVGLSESTTQLLKLLIQRRRPNFYALCGWNMEQRACTAPLHELRDANFSFPSGHSSLTCCGMTFLMWLFLGMAWTTRQSARGKNSYIERWLSRVEVFQCTTVLAILVPLGWAVFVGTTRLVDNWHHPVDVLAGLVLGFSMGTIAYHVWFPPIWWRSSNSSLGPSYPWSVHCLIAPQATASPSVELHSSPSRLSSFHD
jgi:membrane-associated phospholipid phosphatase